MSDMCLMSVLKVIRVMYVARTYDVQHASDAPTSPLRITLVCCLMLHERFSSTGSLSSLGPQYCTGLPVLNLQTARVHP